MAFYDYEAIKRDISIERAMVYLKLKFHKEAAQWRGACPTCGGDDRTLAINHERNVFHCKAADIGGSVLDLVMHVKECRLKEAAQFLLDNFEKKTALTTPKKNKERTKPEGFEPLSHLAHEHESVQDLGFPVEVAESIGIGFASRGLMRSFVAIPLRKDDGTLVGYIGIPPGTKAKVPSTWHGLHPSNVVPLKKRA
jgi:DNA primase